MSNPVVSVVTLTWNGAVVIEPMLRSLLADSRESGIDVEIIVVDNGSHDETLSLLKSVRKDAPQIQIIPLSRNFGTTLPRNIGIRGARADYVLVLDSDTRVPPGTLRGLLDAMTELPDPERIGIVCPMLVYPNGDFQESARRSPTLLTKAFRLLGWEELRRRDESVSAVLDRQTAEVDYGISAAWFIPRRTFERVGLLDELIFYAPEDADFCARVWQAGLKVWYYPKVRIVHDCQRRTNKQPFSTLGLRHCRDLFRYWWRHGSFLVRKPAAGIEADGR
jgi:GT2 family glycosyltransferase